jgi:hypothetical protein
VRQWIGLAIMVIALAIVARRALFLYHKVRAGKPAHRHVSAVQSAEAEAVEVLGQRKLLKKTVPGIAHFFTFWGFTILLLTIIEAIGALFDRHFALPLIGHDSWLGFLEDFFAVAVLVSVCVFAVIRIREDPHAKDRASRF